MAEKVNTYGIRDMFNFYVRTKRKERPYLLIKYPSRKQNTELWYEVRLEIAHLEEKLLLVDEEIQALELKDKNIKQFTSSTYRIYELKKDVYLIKEKLKELKKKPLNLKIMLIDYNMFKTVIYSYNQKAVRALIDDGSVLSLQEKLGYVYIKKIKQPSSMPDWGASKQRKQELIKEGKTPKDQEHPDGENWIVFYENRFFLRWAWKKNNGACRVKNHTVYGFYPTQNSSAGVLGAKGLLVKANHENPMLHLKYQTQ